MLVAWFRTERTCGIMNAKSWQCTTADASRLSTLLHFLRFNTFYYVPFITLYSWWKLVSNMVSAVVMFHFFIFLSGDSTIWLFMVVDIEVFFFLTLSLPMALFLHLNDRQFSIYCSFFLSFLAMMTSTHMCVVCGWRMKVMMYSCFLFVVVVGLIAPF